MGSLKRIQLIDIDFNPKEIPKKAKRKAKRPEGAFFPCL